jgi:hypothetical protein
MIRLKGSSLGFRARMIRLKGSLLEIETKLFGSATVMERRSLSPALRATPLPFEGEGTGERVAH